MWLFLIVDILAIAGGGGSSGGGGGGGGGGSSYSSSGSDGDGSPFSIIWLVVYLAILAAIYFAAYTRKKRMQKEKEATRQQLKEAADIAASRDAIWQPDTLLEDSADVFARYQKDWSNFNIDAMKRYMSPSYYQRNLLMMGALKLIKRQNIVELQAQPVASFDALNDAVDDNQDWFKAEIDVSVTDKLIDTQSSAVLYEQPVDVKEYYRFIRSGSQWLLDGIDESTAEISALNTAIRNFSTEHGYFYSLDWGRLLLPRRGQLFSKGSFAVSDINNHVIGLEGETIIQLYTYAESPNTSLQNFIIAQVAVPKNYGDIIVRKRDASYKGSTRGLKKIRTEWDEFNKKYQVFASNEEQATSFELLNPLFMEQLEALPFEVNIEVVDNIVYIYAPYTMVSSIEDMGVSHYYEKLLDILKAAHKEMRM